MKINVRVTTPPPRTHGGAIASRVSAEDELRRSVLACMLWEDTFYESGEEIAARIERLVGQVDQLTAAQIAVEARSVMQLRHAPLWVVRAMARRGGRHVSRALAEVIQRPDEIAEFLALYWKGGKTPLSAQVKKGLAAAFKKFDEYQFAKWNRDGAVSLRDAMFLSHAKPRDGVRGFTRASRMAAADAPAGAGHELFARIANNALKTPDTWEVALSGGADKRAVFERLMAEGKLGGLAFVRNLRNMADAGVEKSVVRAYAETVNLARVLPFRFVSAAAAVPKWEDICDAMLLRASADRPKLPGKTVVIVDCSGSMDFGGNVSKHSDMSRLKAGGALAAILRERCEEVSVYATAGNDSSRRHATVPAPPRRGLAMVDLFSGHLLRPQIGHGGIFLAQVLDWVKPREHGKADRVVVFTDEQDCDLGRSADRADAFGNRNYIINVSSDENGIAYKPQWTHITGFSEAVVDYIQMSERQQ